MGVRGATEFTVFKFTEDILYTTRELLINKKWKIETESRMNLNEVVVLKAKVCLLPSPGVES